MKKISVIMPAYNAEKTIEKSINSVLSQTFSDFEFLIIDDGSSDNTKNIIKSFSDKRIRYIPKINGGVVSAYKLGIMNSDSEYITFLDSDDLYNPDFLEKAYNDISKYNCDFCSYPYKAFYPDGTLKEEVFNTLPEGIYSENNYEDLIYNHAVFNSFIREKMFIVLSLRWNKIYKSTLLKSIVSELDERCFQIEDNVFMLHVILNSKSCYINNSFFCNNYMFQENSISLGYKGIEVFDAYMYSVNRIVDILNSYKYKGDYSQVNALAFDSARIVFRRCALNGNFSECKKLVSRIKENSFID
ncbi:MAG: glycosyltransferase family 2 protein, partial [Clostridia bacterium]|nr:glycosyltransferase family 2 protein [Clostridia bacterium]